MLLLWDPVARGGMLDIDKKKPHCNIALQNILNMKVNLAFLLTLETIAYILGLQNTWEDYKIITSNVNNEGSAVTIVKIA